MVWDPWNPFERIFNELADIKELLKLMSTGLSALDAAIAAEGTEETTLAGAVNTLQGVITQLGSDIQALITAVQNNPGQDLTNEINAVQGNLATAQATAGTVSNAVSAAQAEDTSVTGETGTLGGGSGGSGSAVPGASASSALKPGPNQTIISHPQTGAPTVVDVDKQTGQPKIPPATAPPAGQQ